MEKEQFKIRSVDYLSGLMDGGQKLIFEKFLKEHPGYQQKFSEIQYAWELMDAARTPEPSEKMDAGFYNILDRQIEDQQKTRRSIVERFLPYWREYWLPQLAFGTIVLFIGLAVGILLSSGKDATTINTMTAEHSETEEIREKLVLTLLEQPSANKRLQAVSESTKLNSATAQIIKALFATLNKDPNVNVRIAALAPLEQYVDRPEVRMGLIQSIGVQESPLVQLALAELMVKLQEKSSVASMKQLLENPGLDTSVKHKIEESINQII